MSRQYARFDLVHPESDEPVEVECEWFARCTNPTREAVEHPVLGPVPCCQRCQRLLEL
ncbi:hypothetical protein SEA_GHOBES_44 [Gordonia phage Ghobes]|uniref:Uncharacterized protein n=1 Tax=Gordonia phage Ghobes TaxID=1887647 RepID=A0A1B3B057_9CAUD|nr:hypothetical protein KCH37_gp44 [Gordonia phage Ghobes]AOE44395.1 hypothetical protein SEA_GHOBES_44 [Gordonia phage Ghobes]